MKKNNRALLIVGILLLVGGISFAFFLIGVTILNRNNNTTLDTAKLIEIEYDAGDEPLNATNLYPGKSATKNFTVTITPGSDDINKKAIYGIFLDIKTNEFTKCTENTLENDCEVGAKELSYTLKDGDQVVAEGDLTEVTGKTRIAKITKTVQERTVVNYTLEITFEDTKKDQNYNKNKNFTADVIVEFAPEVDLTPSEQTLANLGISDDSKGSVDKFTGPACINGCKITNENGLYEAEDDYGTSYYYRGTVNNNWVVFGQDTTNSQYIWWRIIRINGNGTIRLIYAGTNNSQTTAPSTTGTGTMITPRTPAGGTSYPKSVKFNTNYNDNKYVGYMFGGQDGQASTSYEQAHKPETKSTVLQEIEDWYNNKTNLGDLEAKIDVDTGFCGDRTYTETNHGSGYPGTGNLEYGSTATVYGAEKVWQSGSTSWKTDEQTATFKCGVSYKTKTVDTAARKRDLYTGPKATTGGTKGIDGKVEGNNALPVPVGLITMDEVIHAGGFAGQTNNGYWLYTNQYYWTMSPSYMYSSGYASVFIVHDNGNLTDTNVNNTYYGVRPVINLKADTKFDFNDNGTEGSSGNPYVVQT